MRHDRSAWSEAGTSLWSQRDFRRCCVGKTDLHVSEQPENHLIDRRWSSSYCQPFLYSLVAAPLLSLPSPTFSLYWCLITPRRYLYLYKKRRLRLFRGRWKEMDSKTRDGPITRTTKKRSDGWQSAASDRR